MNGIKRFVILLLFTGSYYFATAQLATQLNIDQLTDQQLVQFVQANNLNGLSDFELESKARERGLSNEEIQKLTISKRNDLVIIAHHDERFGFHKRQKRRTGPSHHRHQLIEISRFRRRLEPVDMLRFISNRAAI